MTERWTVPPFDFLSQLTEAESSGLRSIAVQRPFRKHALIFQSGADDNHVYILLDGRVKIFQLSPFGREVIQWFCFPGEIFGLAELNGSRREVYAEACQASRVLCVTQTAFRQFLAQSPHLSMLIVDLLSKRLRVLGDMLLNVTTDDVTSRVVKLLTRLSARYGKRGPEDVYIDFQLTHQEMADMIGASRQTVTTVLNELRRQDVLHIEKHCIHIRKPELLDTMAGRHN